MTTVIHWVPAVVLRSTLIGPLPNDRIDLGVQLEWESVDEPLLVKMEFLDGASEPWWVSRDLLKDGLCCAPDSIFDDLNTVFGEGDIRIWSRMEENCLQYYMEFRVGEHTALLRMLWCAVHLFIKETETLIPVGEENFDIDKELALIFEE